MANQQDNTEWQLAEIVDAIAAEIDRAEDTLSLKSYARGKLMTIKQLKLDLAVDVRYSPEREILFRTAEPGKSSATVLKLDFAQVLESQLQGVRKDLSKPISTRSLTTLTGITKDEIKRLNRIAIYSVDDLERYTQTAAMLAEVSTKTGIPELKIRQCRELPFLSEVKPARGLPGSEVVIEGANLGDLDPNTEILFQGKPAEILEWGESRLRIKMPQVKGSGMLFAIIDGQTTNLLPWTAMAISTDKPTFDLAVRDISFTQKRHLITLEADLVNLGSKASGPFEVWWSISAPHIRTRPIIKKHGSLKPNQKSAEESIRLQIELGGGEYNVSFRVDPNNQHADLNRDNNTFTKTIQVLGVRKDSKETKDPRVVKDSKETKDPRITPRITNEPI
ncbi:MAG: hypothetical protein F6K36_23475 [Symploca sp. SIO3C6]|nr:hypothetical protein [Symploca sp. SIO3C6]